MQRNVKWGGSWGLREKNLEKRDDTRGNGWKRKRMEWGMNGMREWVTLGVLFSLLHSVKGCVSARFPLLPSQSCLHPNSFLIPSAFDPLLIHFSILLLLSQRVFSVSCGWRERERLLLLQTRLSFCHSLSLFSSLCLFHFFAFDSCPDSTSFACLFSLSLSLSLSLFFSFLPSHSLKVPVVKTFAVSMSTSPATTHATKLMQSQKETETFDVTQKVTSNAKDHTRERKEEKRGKTCRKQGPITCLLWSKKSKKLWGREKTRGNEKRRRRKNQEKEEGGRKRKE